MKIGLKFALAFAALVLWLSVTGMAQKSPPFKVVDKADIGANAAADFAVQERSARSKIKFTLGEVLKAESQELEKMMNINYRLCVQVTPTKGKPYTVKTLVSIDAYTNYKLTSWVRTRCGAK
ncbi:MAG: hypothetical protein ABJA02_06750 [Acidobacteriota bacterium]